MSNKLNVYAQATKLSLENAEQWIEDAKLLLEHGSFGHASALLRFAHEETAKAYVCWFTSEGLWPIENKVVKDVFRKHMVKNRVIMAMVCTLEWITKIRSKEGLTEERLEPSDEETIKAYGQFEEVLFGIEKMRQNAMYVNVNLRKKEVKTPLTISKKGIESLLKGAEIFLKIVRHYVEEFPETSKERFREFFSSLPREAWKTGEIPIEWFREKQG